MRHPVLKFFMILIVLLFIATGVFYMVSNDYETTLRKAAECINTGDYDKAVTLYEKAHKKKQKEVEPILGLAKAYYMQDEWDEALKFYYEAQKLDQLSIEIILSLANIHKNKNEFSDAEYLYLQALELDDTVYEAYLNLTEIYRQRNDTDKLSAIVERAEKNIKNGRIDNLLKALSSNREQFQKGQEKGDQGEENLGKEEQGKINQGEENQGMKGQEKIDPSENNQARDYKGKTDQGEDKQLRDNQGKIDQSEDNKNKEDPGKNNSETAKTAPESSPQISVTPAVSSQPVKNNAPVTDNNPPAGKEAPKTAEPTPTPKKDKPTTTPEPAKPRATLTPEATEKAAVELIKPVPAKPEATPAGGYYTEQKTVTLSSDPEGTIIYYTTDGKQPDQYAKKYTQPIVLPEGFTQIKAIAISRDGVVSETAVYDYHVDRLSEIMKAAIYYYDNHQTDLSISKLHEALEINPDLFDAVFRLAELYYEKNDEKNAEIFYQKAIKLDPAYQNGYIKLALIRINRDEVPEAVKILKEGKKHVQGAELSNMLDALLAKPDLPKADAVSGYYNEEIAITLTSQTPGVSIYYTTDGKKPDLSSTPYAGPIRLKEGITTIKAVSVSKALVQSDIAEYRYEIEIPIPINFLDKALESRVRELLQKFNGPITHIDARQIEQLIIIGDQVVPPDKIVLDEKGRPTGYYGKNLKYIPWDKCETTGEIKTLEDLKWFTGLKLLDVRFNQLTDEYALHYGLKYPIAVNFQDKELEEYIRELLKKPKGFILSWDLQDIEKIRIVGNTLVTEDRVHYTATGAFSYYGVDGKEYSWHECAKRGRISTLKDMIWFTGLKDLYIRFNNLTSLDGIEYLNNIKYLDFCYNYINDIDALENLPTVIESVELNTNRIRDISVFQRMDPYAVKTFVGLSYNNITDITPLENIVLEFIYLAGNPIQKGQSTIKNLENRGIKIFK